MNENDTYTIDVTCSNCGYATSDKAGKAPRKKVEIPKGVQVGAFLRAMKCPNCECTTLRKS